MSWEASEESVFSFHLEEKVAVVASPHFGKGGTMDIAYILYSDIFSGNISGKVKAAWHFLHWSFLSLSPIQISRAGKFCGHEKGELKQFRLNEITIIEQNTFIIIYFTATFCKQI